MQVIITNTNQRSLLDDIREINRFRFLFWSLALRDLKVRYKQSILGALWFIVQPLVTCLVFTIVFSYFVRVDSGDIPYPVFVFSGLLLWQFFSRNLNEGTGSLVANSAFINKVYFPRIGVPLINLVGSCLDLMVSLFVLFALMLFFLVPFQLNILFAPLIIFSTFMLGYGLALILAPWNAIYRDIGMAVSFGSQLLMYCSPVIYPVAFLPSEYHWLFDFNPIATLIDWMRWSLIGSDLPSDRAFVFLGIAIVSALSLGRLSFRALEPVIVDRI